MVNYKEILDSIADIEHQQWIHWSKSLAHRMEIWCNQDWAKLTFEDSVKVQIDKWKKLWKPYKELSREQKEQDREWAEKVIPLVPIRCPVYQCGGFMECKDRKKPKDFIESEHYFGDEQTPDLVCSNCKAVYQFKGFKKLSSALKWGVKNGKD